MRYSLLSIRERIDYCNLIRCKVTKNIRDYQTFGRVFASWAEILKSAKGGKNLPKRGRFVYRYKSITYANICQICQNKSAKNLETRKISPQKSDFLLM